MDRTETWGEVVGSLSDLHPLKFTPRPGGGERFYLGGDGKTALFLKCDESAVDDWPFDCIGREEVIEIPAGADPVEVLEWVRRNWKKVKCLSLLPPWERHEKWLRLRSSISVWHEYGIPAVMDGIVADWEREGRPCKLAEYASRKLGGNIERHPRDDSEFVVVTEPPDRVRGTTFRWHRVPEIE